MSIEMKQAGGKSVLFVMAVDAEYGEHLQARITPLMTGVGPVEAAVRLTHALTRLERDGALPDLVVSLGSAGSRSLEQTGIYQVSSVAYRDMDASPLGFEKGRTPFLDHPAVIALPHRIPTLPAASLSTGGNIVSGVAYDLIDADMVDMETFAVLRCCHLFHLPLIGLRGISDGKAELKHVDNWTEYLHVIDARLADAVDALLAALESGELAV
jgi:adenosylhomocysteine nucleosidase